MKMVVIADSHGNIANLKHVMGFVQKIKAGAVIHCGDWDNLKAVETVLVLGIPVYSVLGNADIDSSIRQKFGEKFLDLRIGGRRIGISHDFKHHTSDIQHLDVLFFGHNHRQRQFTQKGVRIVNPGALEKDINFAVYDTQTNKVKFFKV